MINRTDIVFLSTPILKFIEARAPLRDHTA